MQKNFPILSQELAEAKGNLREGNARGRRLLIRKESSSMARGYRQMGKRQEARGQEPKRAKANCNLLKSKRERVSRSPRRPQEARDISL
jgi:hypothetical protein